MNESIGTLNCLLRKNAITKTLSLLTITRNRAKIDYNLLQLPFRECCEIYEHNSFQTNSMQTRGTLAIAFNLTCDFTPGYFFYSLVTRATIKCSSQTSLPMPDQVVARVNDIGAAEGRSYANAVDFQDLCPNAPNVSEHAKDDNDSVCSDDLF